jgi:hypothetical protein
MIVTSFPIVASASTGSATLSGTSGYVVIPSAIPITSQQKTSFSTGYTAMFSATNSFSHIPFIQMGFAKNFEAALALDISLTTDILLQAKWRFLEKDKTNFAFIINGQALDVANTTRYFAAQTGFAATFDSSIMNFDSKTTVYLGYTFDKTLTSDIDFGMAFETPLWKKGMNEIVNLVMDFGNVSYSVNPSGGDAQDRGSLNFGLRLLPVEFIPNGFILADLRLLDLFDHSGRAISAGVSFSFRP